jgi:hypothetical protein
LHVSQILHDNIGNTTGKASLPACAGPVIQAQDSESETAQRNNSNNHLPQRPIIAVTPSSTCHAQKPQKPLTGLQSATRHLQLQVQPGSTKLDPHIHQGSLKAFNMIPEGATGVVNPGPLLQAATTITGMACSTSHRLILDQVLQTQTFFPANTQHDAWRAELLYDHYGQATDTLAHTYYVQTIKTWHALEKIWARIGAIRSAHPK